MNIETVVLVILMVCVLGLFIWVLILAENLTRLERDFRINERHLERLTDRVLDPKRILSEARDRIERGDQ